MSATSFVAIVVVLAFATGFVVAAIIWLISWALSPKDEIKLIFDSFKSYRSKFKTDLKDTSIIALAKKRDDLLITEISKNK
jgi:hypothetical protein